MNSYHVKVAAEAFAAGMFAQLDCEVSIQYGADQPEYDLIIAKATKLAKVSVKGSQDGAWGLTQSYKRGRTYQQAAAVWLAKHDPRTIFCLAQFQRVPPGDAPRVYLATPADIAHILTTTRNGHGDTILHEQHTYRTGAGAGTTNAIPSAWRLSAARLAKLI